MKPKKQIIERAHQNGTMYRVNILLSAAHLAAGISNNLFSEGADLLQDAGLHIGEIKKTYNVLQLAADRYFAEFATMITDPKTKHAFFSDLDDYTLAFRQFVGIEERFTPNTGGEQYQPDINAILEAKQKQLKEFERMARECKSDITRIKEKVNLAKYGLKKGQHFVYKGVEYGNASCEDKNFLRGHKIKKDGTLYRNHVALLIDYDDTVTPLDKFSTPKKGGVK